MSDTLPVLRQDISFVVAGNKGKAEDHWTIYDPVQHRYFRISDDIKRILSIWPEAGGPGELVEAARSRLGIALDQQTFQQIVEFLEKSNLIDRAGPGVSDDVVNTRRQLQNRRLERLVSASFYLKVPLFDPQRLLRVISPILAFLFTRTFWIALSAAGLAGIYFGSDDLIARFGEYQSRFFSNGLLQIVVAIIILKTAHELGHALTAHRYGCRVTSMGVAFMVFIPLLFTDVTDAWRISDKQKRLLITSAGIIAELGLALAATFAWAFMIDGQLREYVFYIAAIGWIASLLFNLNPLLKFDGYFLLSDWLELENLQSRALAYGRWKFRSRVLGVEQPAPEPVEPRTAAILLTYCYLSWIYRVMIFVVISFMIYSMFLKAIAVFLIALFFYFSILRHLISEMKFVIGELGRMSVTRLAAGFSGLLLLGAFVFLPWSSTVRIPAVLQLQETQQIHAPMPAEITAIHKQAGDRVGAGDPVLELSSPSVDLAATKLRIEIKAVQSRLAGSLVSASQRSERLLLQGQLASLNDRLAELQRQQAQLHFAAQSPGVVLELAKDVAPGVWVNEKKLLALLRFGDAQAVLGLVSEQEHWRLAETTRGKFVPDDPTRSSVPVSLVSVSQGATKRMELPELASVNAGPVAVEPHGEEGGFISRRPYHRVEFRPVVAKSGLNQTVTGMVIAKGARQSIASRVWENIAHVVVREFGA